MQSSKPRRPRKSSRIHHSRAEIVSRESSSLDLCLQSLDPVELPPHRLSLARALIDSVADSLRPLHPSDSFDPVSPATNASSVSPVAVAAPATPPDCLVVDSGPRLIEWVAESPGSRARVAMFLSDVAESGRIAEPMRRWGIGCGILSALCRTHPGINAAIDAARHGFGNMLVDRGKEVVFATMAGKSKGLALKAAGLAIQYGPRKDAGGSDEGNGKGPGSVLIQINLDHAAPPPTMSAEQLAKSAIVVPVR